jgi:hypothetical protein
MKSQPALARNINGENGEKHQWRHLKAKEMAYQWLIEKVI